MRNAARFFATFFYCFSCSAMIARDLHYTRHASTSFFSVSLRFFFRLELLLLALGVIISILFHVNWSCGAAEQEQQKRGRMVIAIDLLLSRNDHKKRKKEG